ncbi:YebC/PmpR family DNA-binding transcriptional regulator [Hugenholtzia roseola]|uniref:YebC/PmpR family DNA-binding transcriptional regulator n=1 Tax=Hugenholtzia roseola TaxID=1002 RepID=UPI0004264078|nr:YebC/PmpR family DNA-binding transcriptional regulator [Hugenholtzia roseola]
MGRAFEYRKARKFKRWDAMSRTFTKIGREIAMAVKEGGADPESNTRLRTAMQNARGANMPKDRVESAIKRAVSREDGDFEEIVYEGYGPFGVPIVVECTTNNANRTVAMVRMHLTRAGGSLGKTGSLDFLFQRKGVFQIAADKIPNLDEVELDLIDAGASDIEKIEDDIYIYTEFEQFGAMQKALERLGIETVKANVQRIPNTTQELSGEQEEAIMNLIEKFEDEDDVQAVYHNLA